MWKQFSALLRGQTHEAGERVADRHALVILRQQIRDSAAAVAAARRAVAIATAQNQAEAAGRTRLAARIEDLEARAIAALERGEAALAREAAEAIALLEAERAASEAAESGFAFEIERLRRVVTTSETRLRDLERGQRIAAAADHARRIREGVPGTALSTLGDAEATLSRLRARQSQAEAANAALDEMEGCGDPAELARRLAAAGCGAPVAGSAEAVLERLAKRVNGAAL
jgi:phage shock protein A